MGEESRQRIVDAALEALKTKGFSGASARGIASIGGFNPGLIFYYFDNLDALLIAALDASSTARLERYRPAAEEAANAAELIELLQRIYREDAESGHIRVVSEMVAASVARPAMGPQVVELMEPWVELAQRTLDRVLAGSPLLGLASTRELALAGVTFYLGANLMSHLVPGDPEVDGLLEAAGRGASLLPLLGA
ncbi:MAG: TetR/AcrR family transcriptional regulator [Thermoleophilaceae bacterium]|nr:TetR/AcrR family transcriptional regulator [Thermoleophilaceae bacterium]